MSSWECGSTSAVTSRPPDAQRPLRDRHSDIFLSFPSFYKLKYSADPAAVAPWNEVLVHGYHGRSPPRVRTYGATFTPGLPDWYEGLNEIARNWESNPEAYEAAKKQVLEYMGKTDTATDDSPDEEDLMQESDDESEIDVEEYGLSGAADEFYRRNIRKVVHPEPGVSFSYEQWKAGLTGNAVVQKYRSFGFPDALGDSSGDDHDYYSLRIQDDFRDEGLQVIIKLSSIELTPEKPQYEGGNWHIEGMLNEHIAATALYYYDVDNVTDSRISFRTAAELDSMEMRYEQGKSSEPKAPAKPPGVGGEKGGKG